MVCYPYKGGRRVEKRGILNGNHLKLIAAFTMLVDHMGVMLFPQVRLLRIIGRLAYPISAFMIAEGCRYTKNKLRYFFMVLVLGASCQLVYYLFARETRQNILLTFSCSILLIYTLRAAQTGKKPGAVVNFVLRRVPGCLWIDNAGRNGLWILGYYDTGFGRLFPGKR